MAGTRNRRDRRVLPATAEEEEIIAELTAESVFARLDRGELEIVDLDDWSDVPPARSDVVALPDATRRRRTKR